MSNEKKAYANAKPWYKSKTVWFNVATVVIAISAGMGELLPILAPVVSQQLMTYVVFGVGALNLILRKLTTTGIE